MQIQTERRETRGLPSGFSPTGFDPLIGITPDFLDFLFPLKKEFTPRQQILVEKRAKVLSETHSARLFMEEVF